MHYEFINDKSPTFRKNHGESIRQQENLLNQRHQMRYSPMSSTWGITSIVATRRFNAPPTFREPQGLTILRGPQDLKALWLPSPWWTREVKFSSWVDPIIQVLFKLFNWEREAKNGISKFIFTPTWLIKFNFPPKSFFPKFSSDKKATLVPKSRAYRLPTFLKVNPGPVEKIKPFISLVL